MRAPFTPPLPLDTSLLRPGLRLAVGLSGGADSVALLRVLVQRGGELGLVLHAAHLHHGLRAAEADADLDFCRDLASSLGLPFHHAQVDTAREARAQPDLGKPGETIEEAARRLRYGWFRRLMTYGAVDAVATAHTLDDQAETVLARFLRGAWTEGLSGIHPVLGFPEGRILRPLLGATHTQVEAYLQNLGQPWREDSTNRHLTFTRNRIRHELLPALESWNPRLRGHLAQMAVLARDEDAWWQAEVTRVTPHVLLEGRPVRGGGRASGEGIAIDLRQFAALHPALQRRLLRHAAEQCGFAPGFDATEALRALALSGRNGQKCELAQGLRAERTHRELRLTVAPPAAGAEQAESMIYRIPVPGELLAPAFGLRMRIELAAPVDPQFETPPCAALLRPWRPGDRVRLRHSSGPRKVKEVLERLKVSGAARASWPVLEIGGQILWMQGVAVDQPPGLAITAHPLQAVTLEPS
ncbi:MAG TPA: tRNA lysidine(34) synthetase TilS [Terracidiphilus sp.]|nr:tRNA lysidine(34) synthetase TilS [Terracidiphilus sp.]